MEKLNISSVLPLFAHFQSKVLPDIFTVLYHHVRSLRRYFADIIASPVYNTSALNIFSETNLENDESKNLMLPGLHIHWYEINNSTYWAYFSKSDLDSLKENCDSYFMSLYGSTCANIKSQPVLSVAAAYISLWVSKQQLQHFLHKLLSTLVELKSPFLILFNINIDVDDNFIEQILHARQCVTEITTDYDSLLDHIYINISAMNLQSIHVSWMSHTSLIIKLYSKYRYVCNDVQLFKRGQSL